MSYTRTGGSNTGDSDHNDFITCFGPGTIIKVIGGWVDIDNISRGDRVWTLDNGPQTVRWVGCTRVPGTGANAPVVFAPGSIGNSAELVVLQEHRIYLQSDMAGLLFGESEVLIAAKHLCGLPGVALQPRDQIAYTHFMFDRHHIVRSNGALSESFFFSQNAVSGVARSQVAELQGLFPSLATGIEIFGDTAARALKAREASVLRAYMA